MISVELDEINGIALIQPEERLTKEYFESIASLVDPYIEREGRLRGVVIAVRVFPGWDSFGSLCSHIRFVKDHHKKIGRVAIATDSMIGNLGEKVANHFVNAEIRKFTFAEVDAAKAWIAEDSA